MDDVREHSYLALRLRVAGDEVLHNSYFVNVQTKDFTGTEIWQHRLYFQRPNKWEDLFVGLLPLFCLQIPSELSRSVSTTSSG